MSIAGGGTPTTRIRGQFWGSGADLIESTSFLNHFFTMTEYNSITTLESGSDHAAATRRKE